MSEEGRKIASSLSETVLSEAAGELVISLTHSTVVDS